MNSSSMQREQPTKLEFVRRSYELLKLDGNWIVQQSTIMVDGSSSTERITRLGSLKEALFKAEEFVSDDIRSIFVD